MLCIITIWGYQKSEGHAQWTDQRPGLDSRFLVISPRLCRSKDGPQVPLCLGWVSSRLSLSLWRKAVDIGIRCLSAVYRVKPLSPIFHPLLVISPRATHQKNNPYHKFSSRSPLASDGVDALTELEEEAKRPATWPRSSSHAVELVLLGQPDCACVCGYKSL